VRDFFVGPAVDEKRQVVRVRCEMLLSCRTQEGARICTLNDLSCLGARLSTDASWRKGMKVQLMPPKSMEVDAKGVHAVVVWSRPRGGRHQVGIKFRAKAQNTWVGKLLKELGLSNSVPRQRRKYVRFPSNFAVKFTLHGAEKAAVLKNLSLGGALLSTSVRLNGNVPIQLFIPAAQLAPEVQLIGKVRGSKQLQSGGFEVPIQFDGLNPEQEKGLLKHLKGLMSEAK
jgi:PilZ domain-containing protein